MSLVEHLQPLVHHYGYLAVLFFVALESAGIPMPGETVLISAAIFAGAGALNIFLVIACAAIAAIVGDNAGYWVGREFGFPLIYKYGAALKLDEGRLKVGQYLFLRHGGKIVFFGRFVAVLRAFAAFLAGVNRLPWPRFLVFNALGGIVWATIFGTGGYFLGRAFESLRAPGRDSRPDSRRDRDRHRPALHQSPRGGAARRRPKRRCRGRSRRLSEGFLAVAPHQLRGARSTGPTHSRPRSDRRK